MLLSLLLLAAWPAEAQWVCTPRTVSTRRNDYCLADVMCKPGEVLSGRGSCQFKGCSPYANRPFNDDGGNPVGWRCSGNDNDSAWHLDATVSVTCCKEVEEQQPTPPPDLKVNQAAQPQQASSGSKQEQAQKAAIRVSMLSANQAATLGAVDCADSANDMLKSEKVGAAGVSNCLSSLAAAKLLEDLAVKNGDAGKVNVDEEQLNSEKSRNILAAFEKNFGIPGSEFVQKMVAAGPSKEVLSSLLESKISADKFADVAAGASPGPATEQKPAASGLAPYALALRDADAKAHKAPPAKRRRDLAASLAELPDTLNDSYMIMGETLTPLKGDPLLENQGVPQAQGDEPAYDELTIFDIVHRKYVQKTLMLAPRRPGQVTIPR